MSGYGVPQDSTPASPRSARSASALPVLELVGVGLAALAFIVGFLPWAKADVPDGVDVDTTASGWELALPTAAIVLLLVAALLTVAPLVARPAVAAEDGNAAPVPAMLAVLAAVLVVVYVIIGGSYLGADLSRGIGTWLGLVLGLGTAAVLALSWLQRTGKVRKPAPAAGPSNWGGSVPNAPGQPPGWGQQQPPQYGQPAGYGQQPASQPSGYGQQPSYGAPADYPGAATGGQPAQQPAPYGQEPYGQEQYPPQGGGYRSPGGYSPQG